MVITMTLAKIGAALAILGSVFAAGNWTHSHAEEAIERGDLAQKSMITMNAAEIQLLKTTMDYERLVRQPLEERSEFDDYNIKQLTDNMNYWTDRVRAIESEKN